MHILIWHKCFRLNCHYRFLISFRIRFLIAMFPFFHFDFLIFSIVFLLNHTFRSDVLVFISSLPIILLSSMYFYFLIFQDNFFFILFLNEIYLSFDEVTYFLFIFLSVYFEVPLFCTLKHSFNHR